MKIKGWCISLLLLFLAACSTRDVPAPVVDGQWRPLRGQTQHLVRKGETLYSIAWRYDMDYRELAKVNHLASPYRLNIGQKLALKRAPKPTRTIFVKKYKRHKPKRVVRVAQNKSWYWPTSGKIVQKYNPLLARKGINIAGRKNAKIRATRSGRVAYAGDGLPGYGNLIIIKHNQEYLSAYANNRKNLVKEGQWIKAGDIIAEMGVIGQKKWGLHFEIRKAGKPVNPLNYLKKRV